MKKFILLLFTSFLFIMPNYAQSNDPNVTQIIWGKEAKCSDLNLPTVRNEIIQCSVIMDGLVYMIIDYGSIYCAFSYFPLLDGKVLAGTFKIINRSGKPIFIDVEKSYSAKYASENSFRKKERNKDFKFALDAKKTADKIWLRSVEPSGSNSEIPGIRPGLSAQSRTGVEEGRRGMTVIEPRSQTQSGQKEQRERDRIATVENLTSRPSSKGAVATALTSKILDDKNNTAGRIFFKRFDGAKYRTFVLRIDNLEFVFPLK